MIVIKLLCMVLYWILYLILFFLPIIAAVTVGVFIYLFIKRVSLIKRIKRASKGRARFSKWAVFSVFGNMKKPTTAVNIDREDVLVYIITTPYRLARYHFTAKMLEVIFENKQIVPTRRGFSSLTLSNKLTLFKRELPRVECGENMRVFYVLNPAPINVSELTEEEYRLLSDGDTLRSGATVCGGAYLVRLLEESYG